MNSRCESLVRLASLLLASACLFLAPVVSPAQSIQLTPEQQQMLNQLPPAQRAEALRQLEQLQQGGDGGDLSELDDDLTPLLEDEASLEAPEEEIEEARAEPNSRLIVTLELREELEREEIRQFENDAALQAIEGTRYYELDDGGVLNLPGLPSIPLIGLTEEQVQQRLTAEPALSIFDIEAILLETTTFGVEALEPFGYDLFDDETNRFQPVSTGPVPPDYVLGPGDSIRVQLFGAQNGIYEFEVTRDGILNLPELGPIPVAGLPFSEFRQDLSRRVEQMLIGTQVSTTMGRLRTMRIFVLGDVVRPGSYVVPSLATISSALYQSGGISPVGSLRNIQLKRDGRTIARLDLYDALLRGDTSGDVRLQPGDAIFIPPVGPQVSISGAVKRPAIYEMRGTTSIAESIDLAGGLLAEAYPSGARIERIEDSQRRKVLSVDVGSREASAAPVQGGDALFVPQILPQLEQTVTLVGHVHRPGPYQWRPGMRLTDLIPSELGLQPGADTGYVLIRREAPQTRRVSAVSTNLSDALANPGSAANVSLQARDTVHVFSLAFGRQRVIEPLLEELQLQGRAGQPFKEVSVSGRVKAPGSYPLEAGMRVSDLLRAGGNLAEDAYASRAEIARYEIVDGEYRSTDVVSVDLAAIMRGDAAADLPLMEHDNLRISSIPEWDSLWTITLEGEVRFPGEYRIRRGETLRQVLERAGGLTDAAFAEGAIFLREALREREEEQLEALARRLESELTSLSLQNIDTSGAETLSTGQELLAQLRTIEPVGRLVIDLEQLASRAGNAELVADVELRDRDRLLVPKKAQEVTVIGETQQNTSHLFQPGLNRDDYIQMSGGFTRRADKQLVYIVRASGAVVSGNRSRWLGRGSKVEVRAGDTIVVPLDADRIRPITFWGNVTQILYQAAIAVAAVQTFSN